MKARSGSRVRIFAAPILFGGTLPPNLKEAAGSKIKRRISRKLRGILPFFDSINKC